MNKAMLTTVGMAWLLGGCSLIPEYQRPAPPVPAQYPQSGVYRLAQSGTVAITQDWQHVFHDPALQQLIANALLNTRDLRVAALNVQAFQAQYRIQRADLFPAITSNYSATLGLSA